MSQVKSIDEMNSAECLELYNRISDKKIKRFASLADARRRTKAAQEEANLQPPVLGAEVGAPDAAPTKKPYTGKPRGISGFRLVTAIPNGKSVLQKGSVRRKVFEAVAEANGSITVEALDQKLGIRTRPHLLKLREQGHVKLET